LGPNWNLELKGNRSRRKTSNCSHFHLYDESTVTVTYLCNLTVSHFLCYTNHDAFCIDFELLNEIFVFDIYLVFNKLGFEICIYHSKGFEKLGSRLKL